MCELQVKTKQGIVEGIYDNDVRAFLGVPYAQPPVGKYRFKRPAEKQKWLGVRPCKSFAPQAFQPDLSGMPLYGREFYRGTPAPMSEDCLYLNIWTPAEIKGKLPVLIYIHGGSFDHGCGSEIEFLGDGFAKTGIICVTINYRVGSLGFFAHDDLEKDGTPSGNYGLWDQLFAIKWVKENIEAFGGDSEKITVAGQSAGCMSLQALCCSAYSENLINGAILQSAGGLPGFNRGGEMSVQKEKSLELMKMLGVSTVEEMYDLSAEDIAFAGLEMNKKGMSWLPVIDGDLLSDSVFNLTNDGKILNIPYIIGSTADEMGNGTRELLHKSAVGFADRMNELGRKPVYVYRFDRKLPGDDAGAFHSSELWYEFATLKNCWRPLEKIDHEIEHRMNSSFSKFVRTGDPNSSSLPEWRPYKEYDDLMIFG